MKIIQAQYLKDPISDKTDVIKATIDGTVMFVPLDPDNRHYAEILRQVKEGTLTIKEAE